MRENWEIQGEMQNSGKPGSKVGKLRQFEKRGGKTVTLF